MEDKDLLPVTLTARQARSADEFQIAPETCIDEDECEVCKQPILRGQRVSIVITGLAFDNPTGEGNLVISEKHSDTIACHEACLQGVKQ